MRAGETRPWQTKPARPAARTVNKATILNSLAARQRNPPRAGFDARGAYAELELNGMLVIKSAVPEEQAIGRHLAGQELLGERRPLVRQHVLVADQDETSRESFPAPGVDVLRARFSAADDKHCGNHGVSSYRIKPSTAPASAPRP